MSARAGPARPSAGSRPELGLRRGLWNPDRSRRLGNIFWGGDVTRLESVVLHLWNAGFLAAGQQPSALYTPRVSKESGPKPVTTGNRGRTRFKIIAGLFQMSPATKS